MSDPPHAKVEFDGETHLLYPGDRMGINVHQIIPKAEDESKVIKEMLKGGHEELIDRERWAFWLVVASAILFGMSLGNVLTLWRLGLI